MNGVFNLGELAHSVFLKAMDCILSGAIELANNVLDMTKTIRSEHERLMKELLELPILRTILTELA